MSRSFKKVFGFVDRNPWGKRFANRRVRRIPIDKSLASGNAYRRYNNPWDICDWRFLFHSKAAVLQHYAEWYDDEHYRAHRAMRK